MGTKSAGPGRIWAFVLVSRSIGTSAAGLQCLERWLCSCDVACTEILVLVVLLFLLISAADFALLAVFELSVSVRSKI